jgi:hypothetical protein
MPYSAPALGQGLRLRSRRVRSDHTQASTLRLALIAAILAALVGFIGSMVRDDTLPWLGGRLASASAPPASVPLARPLTAEEQRYADALWMIHTQLEQTVARVGLGTAFYKSQDIDRVELRLRLNQGLAGFRQAEARIEALQPPPNLRDSHNDYLAAVRLFHLSALEMLKMYDDGDEEHLAAALPLSLDGTSKLREISGQFWPDAYPPG